jgi:hypothetical protein
MITEKQLQRFIKMRNRSPFKSNAQFECELAVCEINSADIGTRKADGEGRSIWHIQVLQKFLVEESGKLCLKEAL